LDSVVHNLNVRKKERKEGRKEGRNKRKEERKKGKERKGKKEKRNPLATKLSNREWGNAENFRRIIIEKSSEHF
jgi:hypothetical protein